MEMRDWTENFDEWAESYDRSLRNENSTFPFAGYDAVLHEILECSTIGNGEKILDIGTGTGNLARKFSESGCVVWGMDLSSKMLEKAREKVPAGVFIHADLTKGWPVELDMAFDRVVSA